MNWVNALVEKSDSIQIVGAKSGRDGLNNIGKNIEKENFK